MNYEKFIELDHITLEECMCLYAFGNMICIINDGKIVNLQVKD